MTPSANPNKHTSPTTTSSHVLIVSLLWLVTLTGLGVLDLVVAASYDSPPVGFSLLLSTGCLLLVLGLFWLINQL